LSEVEASTKGAEEAKDGRREEEMDKKICKKGDL
jgi:hypothetical protein